MDREGEGLECLNCEGVATAEEGWSKGLVGDPTTPDVATDGDAIFFVSKENNDLGRGEVGRLGNVSDEVV